MKYFILSIFGKDRPGIVANITRVFYLMGLNIEDSSMTRLNGEFTIMMIVASKDETTSDDILKELQGVAQKFELFLVCKEIPYEEYAKSIEGLNLYRVMVFGADKPGIVYRVSDCIADLGLNISDLRTEKRENLYVMYMECEGGDVYEELVKRLHSIKEELKVDISVEKEEVAEL